MRSVAESISVWNIFPFSWLICRANTSLIPGLGTAQIWGAVERLALAEEDGEYGWSVVVAE
jgi:hypothetical protein